jgi:hypothetical protein
MAYHPLEKLGLKIKKRLEKRIPSLDRIFSEMWELEWEDVGISRTSL